LRHEFNNVGSSFSGRRRKRELIEKMDLFSPEAIQAFFTVVLADLVLAGDNAVVIGLAAAGLPKEQRGKAILIGILAATVLRIGFALIATSLLKVVGLLLAGGILLLWVCWKMWRELREHAHEDNVAAHAALSAATPGERAVLADIEAAHPKPRVSKSLAAAVMQIVIADVSMSIDNVLVVAGAARDHAFVLVFGLTLSVILMGAAAALIARLLHRYRWIGYIGFVIILYVALRMIWDGGHEVCAKGLPMMGIATPSFCAAPH
jgi:YjbE family integral membrane protein